MTDKNNSSAPGGEKCDWCDGKGEYRQTYTVGCGLGSYQSMGPCDHCNGTGKVQPPADSAPASAQEGQGWLTENLILEIFNRVQGRWSNFGGPLNAIYKFAREIESAILERQPAPVQGSVAQADSSKAVYWFDVLVKCARLLDLPDDEPIPQRRVESR